MRNSPRNIRSPLNIGNYSTTTHGAPVMIQLTKDGDMPNVPRPRDPTRIGDSSLVAFAKFVIHHSPFWKFVKSTRMSYISILKNLVTPKITEFRHNRNEIESTRGRPWGPHCLVFPVVNLKYTCSVYSPFAMEHLGKRFNFPNELRSLMHGLANHDDQIVGISSWKVEPSNDSW